MDAPIDVTTIFLQTERLLLRPWREEDLADFYAYASVEGVGEMAGWPHHRSVEESRAILRSFMENREVLAIVLRESGKVIGSLGLHRSWANDEAEYAQMKVKKIGYVLAKEYWGRGLMPEAVRAVIRYCFEELGLDALTCEHFAFNAQSRRVIEKCGFVFVKEDLYEAKLLNKTYPEKAYILLRAA